MTTYALFAGLTVAQAAPGTTQGGPPGGNLPSGANFVNPGGGAGQTNSSPPSTQSFVLVVTGFGYVSASGFVLASNDGVNWITYGTLTASSGASPNIQTANGSVTWAYFSAYLSAISGTNAAASLTMNA